MSNKIYVLLVLLFSRCGPNDSGVSSSNSTIVGSWGYTCVKGQNLYSKGDVTFQDSSYSGAIQYFSDSGCTLNSSRLNIDGTYTVSDNLAGATGAKKIDELNSKVQITILSDSYAASANKSQSCGKTDWKANETVDVKGRSCAGNSNFDIFKLEADTLVFGVNTSELDGTTPEKRPTTLDTVFIYKRK